MQSRSSEKRVHQVDYVGKLHLWKGFEETNAQCRVLGSRRCYLVSSAMVYYRDVGRMK